MKAPTIVTHVAVVRGSSLITDAQFHDADSADSFAATMREQGYTCNTSTGPIRSQTVPVRELRGTDRLADGVVITRLFFGASKVRVTGYAGAAAEFKTVRRAYDYDQLVEIEAR